jgi:beta-galactosidase
MWRAHVKKFERIAQGLISSLALTLIFNSSLLGQAPIVTRERISINEGWRFYKYDPASHADNLQYDVRPVITSISENKVADAKPTEAVKVEENQAVLKNWILPSANRFIKDPKNKHKRPVGDPGSDFPFVTSNFDDRSWEEIDLPHDWAIKGPFQKDATPEVGGGMGRLPINGVAWYRKKLTIDANEKGKSFFLDVDGAMSYAIVWLNGHLVGGWPYGYNSWRLDLTPYVVPGGENQLAIRLDNPNHSSRWYSGAGIYRNVWLTKTNSIHVAQWGTQVITKNNSKNSASVELIVTIDNESSTNEQVEVLNQIFVLDPNGRKGNKAVSTFKKILSAINAGGNAEVRCTTDIKNPKLWGPPPNQQPNLYVCVTTLVKNGQPVDMYETRFGIRSLEFNANDGLHVNGEKVIIKGVNQHHDLGSLGAAFNTSAAQRQLVMLQEMGCNAIRMSHNPPAPELLALTDRMGFLVINEIFDTWERKKTAHDFHLIFQDWSEPDARSFVRRDRNCPSVIIWSFGNEVGEQYTDEDGARIARRLHGIIKEEDPTRPTATAMNYAKPNMPIAAVADIITLNYQGEGIRQAPEFEGTERIRTIPQYDAFHKQFPNKLILSSETASAFSSRGVYLFPVSKELSAPVRDGRGGDSKISQVSAYELHAVDFGATAEKVFSSLERHPYVAGEFVWTGWDHLGEPTPYYDARSAYAGIIDLAGFKKNRFFLYQSQWRPDLPMAHILPHWNWPERIDKITPVHVFTSGDEAELFLNGLSLGRKKKQEHNYRLRWDSVTYTPGELKVVAYKNGKHWTESSIRTSGEPIKLSASVDRKIIYPNDDDLAFITVQVVDRNGALVPRSNNLIEFSIDGPGEIVATDNGDATNMVSFLSPKREAFNGLCLVVVRAAKGKKGTITLNAKSNGLTETKIIIQSK